MDEFASDLSPPPAERSGVYYRLPAQVRHGPHGAGDRRQHGFKVTGGIHRILNIAVQDLLTEATLKIVRRTGNILMLEPANRRYKVLSLKGAERRRVAILGKLAGIVHRTC